MSKKTVLLRAPVLTESGYGVHSRQVAKWLLSKPDISPKFHILPWGDTPWIINSNYYDGLIGQIMDNSVEGNYKADVSIQVQLPNEWDTNVGVYNVGITAGVETDRCNPDWIHCLNKMNKVIVPSKHTKVCFENTGTINKEIEIIPESYPDALLQENPQKFSTFPTNFNFLIFGQLTGNNAFNDRKNIFFTIKWLCEAFKDDKDVGIIIKTNAGRNTKLDRKNVKAVLSKLQSECKKGPYPRIYLLHGDLYDQEVASLYKHPQVKALVSATRGEGYGLPILEAAVSGLPVIATGWSGHLDFLNHGRFLNLEYDLIPVHQTRIDNKIFLPGFKWANPREDDFKKKVLKFRSSSSVPKEWAIDLAKKLQEKYSFEKICQLYDMSLQGIL